MVLRRGAFSLLTMLFPWAMTALPVLAAEPLPYRLQVEVAFDDSGGSASFRDELEYEFVATLRAAGCFRAVQSHLAPPFGPADLLLALTVSHFDENIAYELSIAQRASPSAGPDADQRRVAHISAVFQADVTTLVDPAPVRSKRFRLAYAWRPLLGEDPRQKVQRDLLSGAGRKLRSFICKGSAKSWSKQVERARDASRSSSR